jgi:hypothetical protein
MAWLQAIFTREFLRRYRWLLVLLAVVIQSIQFYLISPIIQHDAGYQMGAVNQLLDGQGVTLELAKNPQDISQVQLASVTWWPPAVTVLATPLYVLTQDFWWTMYLIDVLGLVLYFVACACLFSLLSDHLSPRLEVCVWLFWIFFYPPIHRYTDQMSLACFVWGVVMAIVALKYRRWAWCAWIVAGVFLGLTLAFRYASVALLPVLPLAVIWYAWRTKDRTMWRDVLWFGVGALFILVPWYLWNISTRDNADRTTALRDATANVIYFDHLMMFRPFVADTFGITMWNLPTSGLPNVLRIGLPWLFSFIIGSVGAVATFRWLNSSPTRLAFWSMVGLLATTFTVVMLAYLSLRSPYLYFDGIPWTFVGEMRYFAPAWLFVFITYFYVLDQPQSRPRYKRWRQVGIVLVVLLGFLGMFSRMLSVFVFIANFSGAPVGEARIPRPFYHIIKTVQADQAISQPIVVVVPFSLEAPSWELERSLIALSGEVIFDTPVSTKDTQFSTSKPMQILFILPPNIDPEWVANVQAQVEVYQAPRMTYVVPNISDDITPIEWHYYTYTLLPK